MTPLLTVVVPAYNAEPYLARALDSLVGFGPAVEVLGGAAGATPGPAARAPGGADRGRAPATGARRGASATSGRAPGGADDARRGRRAGRPTRSGRAP